MSVKGSIVGLWEGMLPFDRKSILLAQEVHIASPWRRNRGLFSHFNQQHTIGREVGCEGVGLHSGTKVSMKIKPAAPNFGIRFRRADICAQPILAAHFNHVVDTLLATTIGFDGVVVATIEHLMAALAANGVDNVLVELNGPEVPIFDGSAACYVDLLKDAGLQEQNAFRQVLKVAKPLVVKDGDSYIKASPSDRFQIRYAIDFPHPLVGKQEFLWGTDFSAFDREIAKARTFGFLRDVQKLQSLGLARGGSLSNAIVFDDSGILNLDGFRYADECVRHKVLDFIGDMALAGMPIIGSFEAYKAGHGLHNRLLRELMTGSVCYTLFCEPCVQPPVYRSPYVPRFLERMPVLTKSI